jgi:hypothetical protein
MATGAPYSVIVAFVMLYVFPEVIDTSSMMKSAPEVPTVPCRTYEPFTIRAYVAVVAEPAPATADRLDAKAAEPPEAAFHDVPDAAVVNVTSSVPVAARLALAGGVPE